MSSLTQIELSDLFDMLSEHTAHYMKMLSDGASRDEFDECRQTIINLQSEILLRQKQKADAAAVAAGKNISFAKDFPRNLQKK